MAPPPMGPLPPMGREVDQASNLTPPIPLSHFVIKEGASAGKYTVGNTNHDGYWRLEPDNVSLSTEETPPEVKKYFDEMLRCLYTRQRMKPEEDGKQRFEVTLWPHRYEWERHQGENTIYFSGVQHPFLISDWEEHRLLEANLYETERIRQLCITASRA